MTDGTSLATDGVVVRYPTWGCRCCTKGTFAREPSVEIVALQCPLESARWHLMRSTSGRNSTSKPTTVVSLLQKEALLPKLSDRLRTCRRSCRPEGKQKVMTIRLTSPGGPKGCLNGCSPSRRQQVCVCEQTIASLMATVAARTKVVSMSTLMITVAIAFLVPRWTW